MIQLKENTGRKRTKSEPEKRQVEKDEDGIVFDRDALMDKVPGNDYRALKNRSKKRLSRDGFVSKDLESLTQGKKTWTDATILQNAWRGPRGRRAQELAEARS